MAVNRKRNFLEFALDLKLNRVSVMASKHESISIGIITNWNFEMLAAMQVVSISVDRL